MKELKEEGTGTATPPTEKKTLKEVSIDICKSISDRFIEALKNGVMPWRSGHSSPLISRPINFFSGKYYSGINWLILNALPFKNPIYLTFKQAMILKLKFVPGSAGTGIPIMIFRTVYYDKITGAQITPDRFLSMDNEQRKNVRRIPYISKASVFNIEQFADTESLIQEFTRKHGRAEVVKARNNKPDDNAKMLINLYAEAPEIVVSKPGAVSNGYSETDNKIYLPDISEYPSSSMYYKAVFRELIHSTGTRERMGRTSFIYREKFDAFERLISEIGAQLLCKNTGIDSDDLFNDSAFYVKEWIGQMSNDPQYIVKAAFTAQKAINYISGNQHDQEEKLAA